MANRKLFMTNRTLEILHPLTRQSTLLCPPRRGVSSFLLNNLGFGYRGFVNVVLQMTGGSPGTPPTSEWPLKSPLAPCMSEASRGRTRDRAAKPSPFACCSRVSSRDSPKSVESLVAGQVSFSQREWNKRLFQLL